MSTVQIGVTVAVKADDVDALGLQGGPDAVRAEFRDLAAQALPRLREYVGGAEPQADPAVDVRGPVDDPLQGMIYALSLAAPFNPDDLPSTCEAYGTYVKEGPAR